ncbi:MAG: hypothetical protein ACI8V5_003543, partial [Limisphaerales bacterium]
MSCILGLLMAPFQFESRISQPLRSMKTFSILIASLIASGASSVAQVKDGQFPVQSNLR